jgi:hypothetical protein
MSYKNRQKKEAHSLGEKGFNDLLSTLNKHDKKYEYYFVFFSFFANVFFVAQIMNANKVVLGWETAVNNLIPITMTILMVIIVESACKETLGKNQTVAIFFTYIIFLLVTLNSLQVGMLGRWVIFGIIIFNILFSVVHHRSKILDLEKDKIIALADRDEFWKWLQSKKKDLEKTAFFENKKIKLSNLIRKPEFWTWLCSEIKLENNFLKTWQNVDPSIDRSAIEFHKKNGGLFLTQYEKDETFPNWKIATCRESERILFSIGGYFDFFTNEGIMSKIKLAISFVSADTEPLPKESPHALFFKELLKNDTYIGFAIHGDITSIKRVFNQYKDLLLEIKTECPDVPFDRLCIIPCPHITSSQNAGYLLFESANWTAIGFEALINAEKTPKAAFRIPDNLVRPSCKKLAYDIAKPFTDPQLRNIRPDQIKEKNLVKYNNELDVDHIAWLVNSGFLNINEVIEKRKGD